MALIVDGVCFSRTLSTVLDLDPDLGFLVNPDPDPDPGF